LVGDRPDGATPELSVLDYNIPTMTVHPEVAGASAPMKAPVAQLDTRGPYDLAQVAMMGFGHRDELSFDGVMRLAFASTVITSARSGWKFDNTTNG